MERKVEIEVKNDLKVTPIAKQAEVVNPVNERAVAETMRILSNFILLEDRVKKLETSSSENSSNNISPAVMRRSASNKNMEKFKEEIKQECLVQSRRTDAVESCTTRLEKEINLVKSQASVAKKAVSSDQTLKDIENKIEVIKTSVEAQEKKIDVMIEKQEAQEKQLNVIIQNQDVIIERQEAQEKKTDVIIERLEAQEKKTDVIIESLKNIDESQSKISKRFTNFEYQMKQLNELLTKNLVVGRVGIPEEEEEKKD